MPEAPDLVRGSLTLRAVLRLPVVRRGHPAVAAGHEGLDRPIRWVHAGEVPTIATLLKGGELLLTTGMGIGARGDAQGRFISQLAQRGVAGVMVELGTTFDELPGPLVRAADDRSVPLIALTREMPFVEITEAVHREILNRRFVLMRRGAVLDREFFSLVLDGAGVADVLAALAGAIGNPVALQGADGSILSGARHHRHDPVALAAAGAAPPTLSQAVPIGSAPPARLVAFGSSSPFDAFDRVALERAASVIALILLREHAGDREPDRGSLLGQLLDSELDEPRAAALASGLGIPARPGSRLAVAASLSTLSVETAADVSWARALPALRRHSGRSAPVLASTRDRGRVVLLAIPLPGTAAREEAAAAIAETLHAAAERQLGVGEAPVVCVGRVASTWTGIGTALREALNELPIAGRGAPARWHDATRPRLDALLWSLRDEPELRDFVGLQLGAIAEPGGRRADEMLATLAVLCAHGGRKAEAARELGLERQSLYRRLRQIESVLGLDLADEDAMFRVHLALRAKRHFDSPFARPPAGHSV